MAAFAKSGVGSSADDKPSPTAGSAFCAGLGRHILHPADGSGGHIRACPESLVASPAPSACAPLAQLITNSAPRPLFRLRQSRFPISFAPWLAQCALSHFTSSARPTSVNVMSAIGSTVVKVGHHPIVTTKRRASSAAFKCSISSNMPLTTTPFLNAMKPRWTPWPQHADLTPGKKPIHGSHPSVFCS